MAAQVSAIQRWADAGRCERLLKAVPSAGLCWEGEFPNRRFTNVQVLSIPVYTSLPTASV